jgi:hypothetical protein
MMDTDSFVLKLPTADMHGDMERMNEQWGGRFDMSNTGRKGPYDGLLGAFKDEAEGTALVRHLSLQAKVYVQEYFPEKKDHVRKAKGIVKYKAKSLEFRSYESALEDQAAMLTATKEAKQAMTRGKRLDFAKLKMQRLRVSQERIQRKGLSAYNDKVFDTLKPGESPYLTERADGSTRLRPLGHYRNR